MEAHIVPENANYKQVKNKQISKINILLKNLLCYYIIKL